MAQVITPPAADKNEQAAKNWQKAQHVRQIMQQLTMLWGEHFDVSYEMQGHMRDDIDVAINALRGVFNALVPEEQRMSRPRVKRRGGA